MNRYRISWNSPYERQLKWRRVLTCSAKNKQEAEKNHRKLFPANELQVQRIYKSRSK